MNCVGNAIGAVIAEMVFKGLVVSVGGGISLEVAALSGARALQKSEATASKVAKYILAVMALVGAFVGPRV
jgi:hypothetical protein